MPYEVVREVGNEEYTGVSEDERNGGSLVSAEFEVGFDVGNPLFGGFGCHPLFEDGTAEPFFARSQPNDYTALFDGVFGVVKGFLGLVHVLVFGVASGGYDDDIGFCGDLDEIQTVQELTACPMGGDGVAGNGENDFFVLVQNDVDDVVDAEEGSGFLYIHTDGALEVAGMGFGHDHHFVVLADGFTRRHAGHDGFGAAAVTGEVVVLDVAHADAEIGFRNDAEYVYGGAGGGNAYAHAVVGIGIDAVEALEHIVPYQVTLLFLGVVAVTAEGEYDGDILVPDSCRVQTFDKRRQDDFGGHRASDVAGDDTNFHLRFNEIADNGRAYRVIEGAFDLFCAGQIDVDGIGEEFSEESPRGNI